MKVFLVISAILLTISFIASIGFLVTLIAGIASKSKKALKTGKIGLIIASSIFAISIVSTTAAGVMSIPADEVRTAKEDDTDYDSDSNDDDSDYDSDDEDEDTDYNDFGDSVEFESGEKVTVNSVEDSDADFENQDDDEYGVVANVTVENPTKKALDFDANDFSLTDGDYDDGYLDDKTFNQDEANKKIPAGKEITLNLYYDIGTQGDYTVSYGDNTWE